MDMKSLLPAVLIFVLIGLVVGVGVLVFDEFGDITSATATVANESVTVVNGAGSLTGYNILTVTSFADNQSTITSGILTHSTLTWDTTAGSFVANGANAVLNWTQNTTYYVYYTYDKDSVTTTTMASVRDGITPVTTTWLSLIVIVVVLAIILGLIMNTFNNRR